MPFETYVIYLLKYGKNLCVNSERATNTTFALNNSASGTTTVDTFNGALYRTAKYIMQVEDGAGNYESREALVVHDGTSAYISEYAIVYTGADLIGDASVEVSGNNINLTYTPTSGTATVKVIATYIDV